MSATVDLDITDVKEVQTVYDDKTVNDYLKAGWVLLAKYVEQNGANSQGIRFVMAWRREGDPVKPSRTQETLGNI